MSCGHLKDQLGKTDLEKEVSDLIEEGKRKRVIVLAGPTGCGKTKLSLILAKMISGEIVSADSMQLYRGMDIGTAKASIEEQKSIPHHMLDVCDISSSYTVVDYYYRAHECIKSIIARGRVPIVVGGSGFYIRTLIYGPPPGPPSIPEVRERLELEMEVKGVDVLFERLQELDPTYAESITIHDKQKVIRALEIITLSGSRVSDLGKCQQTRPKNYDFRSWFLYRPREALYAKIDERCEKMVAEGLVDEVRFLRQIGLEKNRTASNAIGYRQTLDYLDTPQTEEDFQDYIKKFQQASRHYAKRQLTWFRKEPMFLWLDIEPFDYELIAERIAQDYYSL